MDQTPLWIKQRLTLGAIILAIMFLVWLVRFLF